MEGKESYTDPYTYFGSFCILIVIGGYAISKIMKIGSISSISSYSVARADYSQEFNMTSSSFFDDLYFEAWARDD